MFKISTVGMVRCEKSAQKKEKKRRGGENDDWIG